MGRDGSPKPAQSRSKGCQTLPATPIMGASFEAQITAKRSISYDVLYIYGNADGLVDYTLDGLMDGIEHCLGKTLFDFQCPSGLDAQEDRKERPIRDVDVA